MKGNNYIECPLKVDRALFVYMEQLKAGEPSRGEEEVLGEVRK